MLGLRADHKTITGKFSKQAESALSDERFRPVEFSFDVTQWGQNAQLRLFHIFAAYVTIMAEYNEKHFVPRQLESIAEICTELKNVFDQHVGKSQNGNWAQDTFDGMEYTAK
jgi:hypothetical protein